LHSRGRGFKSPPVHSYILLLNLHPFSEFLGYDLQRNVICFKLAEVIASLL